MRDIPAAFAAHLAGAATTLCRCWSLIRRDGLVLGFTDHDRPLAFEGVAFRETTGLEAAEGAAELGFAVGGGEVSGAFAAVGLNEADLARGELKFVLAGERLSLGLQLGEWRLGQSVPQPALEDLEASSAISDESEPALPVGS